MTDMPSNENPFHEVMRGQTTAALLAVVRTREQYQPAAVEAALAELALRNVSPDEIAQIEMTEKLALAAQQHNLGNRAKAKGRRLIEQMNPFRYSGVERDIAMIVASISYYFIFLLLTGYEDLLEASRFLPWGAEFALLLAPYILVPAGLYFFRKKDPLGWTILCAWVVYSLATIAGVCFSFYRYSLAPQRTGLVLPPAFSHRVDISGMLLNIVIFAGMLYALNRKRVREALRISANWQWATILLTATFSFIIMNML